MTCPHHPFYSQTSPSAQRGSAIFVILIATALFAALAFVFMQGSRTSTGFLNEEQAKVKAQQIMAYGNDVRNAVRRLQLRNCTAEQISFENPVDDRYVNTNNSPETCKIFSSQGGGLGWLSFSSSAVLNADLVFTAGNRVNGVLTDLRDLTMIYGPIEESVCQEINKSLDIAKNDNFIAVDHDWFSLEPYTGTLASGGPMLGSGTTPGGVSAAGKLAGCMQSATSGGADASAAGSYYYYNVLIAR